MSPTTEALRNTLAEARGRAQYEGREVICVIEKNGSSAAFRHQGSNGHAEPGAIRVIVRPDEPIVFWGLLPA
jgi:hypothetical protein